MPKYASKYVGAGSAPSGWTKVGSVAVDTTGVVTPSDYPFSPGVEDSYDSTRYIIISDTTTAGLVGRTTGGNTGPTVSSNTPTYWSSAEKTDESFLSVVKKISGSGSIASASAAKTWLDNNGYWTSWTSALAALLLDTYSGAAAAYSLRKLSNTYAGSAIRVRRSSDNTEQNIGFDGNGGLDTTALTTFVGAGNGFVTTWYDQSGSGRNMTQTTANLQPTIVSAGSILLQSGKPKISLSGGKWFTSNTPYSPTTRRDAFFVTNNDGDTVFLYPDDYAGSSYAYGYVASNGDGSTNLYYNPDSTPSLYVNNTLQSVSTRAQVYTALNGYKLVGHENFRNIYSLFNLGRYSGYEYGGSFQEVIYYFSDQSSNRSGINSNINTYYSIYPTDADAAAFVSAAGITDSTQMSAVNTLVTDLKSAGIWTKMKAIYPFVGGTATSHSYNLKNTAQYQITWSGGLTHSSTGVLPNGVNALGNLGFPLYETGGTGVTPQDNHISFYSRTNLAGLDDIYLSTNSNLFLILLAKYTGNNNAYYGNWAYYYNTSNADATGFYLGKSVGSSAKLFRNGSSIVSGTISATSFSGSSMNNYGLFRGLNGYGNKECAFASIGLGLSDTEAANFYTAVQAFQTTLGRQV